LASITFDSEAKALYIQIIEGAKLVDTVPVGQGKYMDISVSGKAIRLEIIFPSSTPDETFKAIIQSKEAIRQLVH
jgi:uncharacterized protein YuzE